MFTKAYYIYNNKIIDKLPKFCDKSKIRKYNGVSDYLKNPTINGTNCGNEKIKRLKINTNNLFKIPISTKEGMNILINWYNKWKNFIIDEKLILALSAGLDSRVFFSMIYKEKNIEIKNYSRNTFMKCDETLDLNFPDIVRKKYNLNLIINNESKKKSIGGYFSEWCRDLRVFTNKDFISFCYKTMPYAYCPFIDEELLQLYPICPDLLNTIILLYFAPDLLELPFQSGNNIYNKNKLPLDKANKIIYNYKNGK